MSPQPSGTVTFLFTDVVGSTRLWETDREGMERSLAAHDRIITSAIADSDGVVFATGGDSFSSAFPTAPQAARAAVSAQRRLQAHGWDGPTINVRMGMHTGAAEEREGNYFGVAVSRAARIMAAGHGGQVLVSDVSAGLIRDGLDEAMTLVDRGSHTLAGLERPEHIFELRHADFGVVDTPLATASIGGVHLPGQLTSFVGRAVELDTVVGLLDGSRIVTLTGVGGTGKTRLAIEAARSRAEAFPDGVWIAELAAVTDPGLVLAQVADLWDLRPGEGASLAQVLAAFLRSRRLLLVIDNCEHVLEAAASLVGDLLAASSGLTILATSRESLGVSGETVYRVPSMTLPENGDGTKTSDAVALFLERFRSSRPGYSPTEEDLAAIARVARRLDGIPLGLELAAARLRVLSAGELAERLDVSFRVLSGSSKTALPRQRTLQATIDWSYDLLEPTEQALFRLASTFVGGFDLTAAAALAAGTIVDELEVLDLLDQLVDKSLLTTSFGSTPSRFRMLEPIRQYAQERLADEGEAERARAGHAAHYIELVARAEPRLRGPDQRAAHDQIRLELDNIRAAASHLEDVGEIDRLLELCFDLAMFWMQASMQVEGLDTLLPVLEADPAADAGLLAKGWWVASMLAFNLTDPVSVAHAERGLAIAQAAGDDTASGWLSVVLATAIAGTTSGDGAAGHLQRGERLIRDGPGDPWWDEDWARVFLQWSRLFVLGGTPELGMADLAGVVDAALGLGDHSIAAGMMTGAFFLREDDADPRALTYLEQAVDTLDELGFRHALGHSLLYWGWLTREEDRDDRGLASITRGATMLAELGDIPCALNFSTDAADHLMQRGHVAEAVPHLAFSASQAKANPDRFLRKVADSACRAMVAAGDLSSAALIAGYQQAHGATSTSYEDCLATLASQLPGKELTAATARGALLGGAELLDMIESWEPTPIAAVAEAERHRGRDADTG